MTAPEAMLCLGCGYDLRGLPENRCPECGRAFDPVDPTTFAAGMRDGRPYLALSVLSAVVVAVPFTPWFGLPAPMLLPFQIGAMIVSIAILWKSMRILREPRGCIRYRYALAFAAFVCILSLVGCCSLVYAALTFRWQD
jgi:hypothetical protein